MRRHGYSKSNKLRIVSLMINKILGRTVRRKARRWRERGGGQRRRKIKNKYLITEKCVPGYPGARRGGAERAGKVNEGDGESTTQK